MADEPNDTRPMSEDTTMHTLARFYEHSDGRMCGYHSRLGVWTTGFEPPVECLRDHDAIGSHR